MASGMAPPAMSLIDGSTFRIALAIMLCFSTHCATGIAPNCHSPQGSFPTPQNWTL